MPHKYSEVSAHAEEAHDTRPPQSPPVRSSNSKNNLFALRSLDLIPLYILAILGYTLAVLIVLIWISRGAALPWGQRVLKTGTLHVNQIYSGLALSALLTPAAIIIRTLGHSLGLIHPFSIAYGNTVSLKDLDKIMDPGATSIPSIARYSWRAAFVQTVLLAAGALLVPIGTLMVTTGPYTPQIAGTDVVGLPTLNGNGASLDQELSDFPYASDEAVPDSAPADTFAWNVANLALGTFISQPGNVSAYGATLGPVTTGNITFQTRVTYHGIVTYTWDPACQSATDEITYSVQINATDPTNTMVVFTMPGEGGNYSSYLLTPSIQIYGNATERAGLCLDNFVGGYVAVPYGGTLYFATGAYQNVTMHYPEDQTGLTVDDVDNIWVTRTKCTPTLQWTVSSCTWDGASMANCNQTLNQNVPALSVDGLNKLSGYMVASLMSAYIEANQAYGTSLVSLPLVYWPDATGPGQWRAPGLNDYWNFLGAFAKGIATATTVGYYGTAKVPTMGKPERLVYIARVYIMGSVLAILAAVVLVSTLDILYMIVTRSPLRKASFVTVAAAVRSNWWNEVLQGRSSMSHDQLRKSPVGQQAVTFGEELQTEPPRIGLAPEAGKIEQNKHYTG
ncbi:hypothetical protein LTS15_009605 [Exophiala xenobiotica]|nr:hypothetical protein LTS15_009605 [Exophiala xenobiotica]